jgi:hypothetical protein
MLAPAYTKQFERDAKRMSPFEYDCSPPGACWEKQAAQWIFAACEQRGADKASYPIQYPRISKSVDPGPAAVINLLNLRRLCGYWFCFCGKYRA